MSAAAAPVRGVGVKDTSREGTIEDERQAAGEGVWIAGTGLRGEIADPVAEGLFGGDRPQ